MEGSVAYITTGLTDQKTAPRGYVAMLIGCYAFRSLSTVKDAEAN